MLIDSHSAGICLPACPSFIIQRRDVYPSDQVVVHTTSSSGSNTLCFSQIGAYCVKGGLTR